MKSILTSIALFSLLAFITSAEPVRAAAANVRVAVIVNASNSVKADDYDVDALKKIFLKQSTAWPDKDKTEITPYQLASGTDEADVFRKEVLGKDAKELSKYWSDKKADDGTSEPISKKTSDEIYKLVAKDASAIGYINSSYYDGLTDEQKKAVKVLRTIG
ncbi:MAG: hypothetical protein L6Q71_01240 [Planctomycetes bacterium]|nr:hypothetical protein [Planctomycetota bacterium]